jgi:hypothetical protein
VAENKNFIFGDLQIVALHPFYFGHNGFSKMQTAPILKSSTVSNYGDISHKSHNLPVNLTIRSVFVECGQK